MLESGIIHNFNFEGLPQGGAKMMAVAHVDDDQNAAARITPRGLQHALGEMRRVNVPYMSHVLTGQPCDGVVEFIRHMMSPALIDGGGIRRSALQPNQPAPQ